MNKRRRFFFSREAKKTLEDGVPEPRLEDGADEKPGRLVFAARTDVGRVRLNNQDALIECGALLGVADGMGGHKGGEVASDETRQALIASAEGKTPSEDALREAVLTANKKVYDHSVEEQSLSGMGTTCTLAWFGEKEVYLAQVGDSRCYLLRGGELRQVTQDHSMVAELVRSGMLTEEDAARHPMRNIITRAVGTDEELEVDTLTLPRRRGDRWLLCSDGLYGMLTPQELKKLLQEEKDADACADRLMESALEAGGRDNVSLIVADDREVSE